VLLAFALSVPAMAQGVVPRDPPKNALQEALDRRAESSRLQAQAVAAFEAGDIDAALTLLNRQLELEPDNPLALYNLACVRCVRGDRDEAITLLRSAIERGFVDFEQMRRDPNLAALHDSEMFQQILANRTPILDAAGNMHFDVVKDKYRKGYVYDRDEDLHLTFACAYDKGTLEQAIDELHLLSDWAIDELFTSLADPPMREADPWVVVVLPTERDFRAWAIATYGPAAVTSEFSRIGGSYHHQRKELVAMDLGGTLRHEFLHVLHWRDNMRHGQLHPTWIQEGLCSLVEDYDVVDGHLVPVPSWRTNTVKRLARTNRIIDLTKLANMDHNTFNTRRPLANYAVARSFFLYLYQRHLLSPWYANYVEHYADDPTGIASIEAVTEMDIASIQRDFRDWAIALPQVAEARSDGSVSGLTTSLGVEVDPGRGEGPIITRVTAIARNAGLRPRDIITSIDSRPTRDMNDFVRVLSSYRPAQHVSVHVRRRSISLDIDVPVQGK